MELNQQVTSLALSQRLKELGVKQGRTLFEWIECYKGPDEGFAPFHCLAHTGVNKSVEKRWTAFTVAEMGNLLWKRDIMYMPVTINKEWCGVDTKKGCHVPLGRVDDLTEADARAAMLIYLIENDLI